MQCSHLIVPRHCLQNICTGPMASGKHVNQFLQTMYAAIPPPTRRLHVSSCNIEHHRLRRQNISHIQHQPNDAGIRVIHALYHCVFPTNSSRNLPSKVSCINRVIIINYKPATFLITCSSLQHTYSPSCTRWVVFNFITYIYIIYNSRFIRYKTKL